MEEVAFSGKINANFNSRKNFFSFFFVLKGEGWLIEKDALQHSCVCIPVYLQKIERFIDTRKLSFLLNDAK